MSPRDAGVKDRFIKIMFSLRPRLIIDYIEIEMIKSSILNYKKMKGGTFTLLMFWWRDLICSRFLNSDASLTLSRSFGSKSTSGAKIIRLECSNVTACLMSIVAIMQLESVRGLIYFYYVILLLLYILVFVLVDVYNSVLILLMYYYCMWTSV